jgi:ABC-type anion transport system duplicated permease subunit
MSGLRPVAAFFIVFTAIAWVMVVISVAKTATVPAAMHAYQSVPDPADSPADGYGLSNGGLDRLLVMPTLPAAPAPR